MVSASIVTYNTDCGELRRCVDSLRCNGVSVIYVSDNSPDDSLRDFCDGITGVEYIHNGRNLGYGAGHNVAIRKARQVSSDYHLVINSDVYFGEGVIGRIVSYMDANEDVAQVIPGRPDFPPFYAAGNG